MKYIKPGKDDALLSDMYFVRFTVPIATPASDTLSVSILIGFKNTASFDDVDDGFFTDLHEAFAKSPKMPVQSTIRDVPVVTEEYVDVYEARAEGYVDYDAE